MSSLASCSRKALIVENGVALLEDVHISNGDIEQKMKNVLIKFSALGSAAIIALNLVTPVNSTHELVVVDD